MQDKPGAYLLIPSKMAELSMLDLRRTVNSAGQMKKRIISAETASLCCNEINTFRLGSSLGDLHDGLLDMGSDAELAVF